ncbi:MAG: glycosyl hydrolase, partial [Flavobacteriales bacterium]
MKNFKFLSVLLLSLFVSTTILSQKSPSLKSALNGFKFRSLGPAFMSGRIADIAIDPTNENVWYVAVGSGGVWKTTNAGTTWKAISENESFYSTGCITIDPNNNASIWLGTGENVGGRHVGIGHGIYHSKDGGKTWEDMGLKNSEHISKIIVHPKNPDIIWVAAQGPLWSKGGERGLYKSMDGGKTWKNTLFINEWTGATDLVIDPTNPSILYAATWQRHRNVAVLMGGGPGTSVYKSTDGGENWNKIDNGIPKSNKGKIGLAISPMKPNVLYAAVELELKKGAVYRSSNSGGSWQKMSNTVSGGTGPHYYQELVASPHVFDKIYLMNVRMLISENGGKDFYTMKEKSKHSDNHALAFKKNDPNYMLVGSDGGMYESFDNSESWKYVANLPITQYYKLALDDSKPFYKIYGGTQDNNTQSGPSRTFKSNGISNSDWEVVLGGDGHQPATEPGNPDIVYAQWQQGNLNRIDRTNGERVYIQPQAAVGEPKLRFNWDAPILVSQHDPKRLYFGTQKVFRSENRGDSWTSISGDLTKNEERLSLPVMGKVQSYDNAWDVYAMSTYNTITSLAESKVNEDILYAGTDDGIIQTTKDGGKNWTKMTVDKLPGTPASAFVNDIKADLFDENKAYVALDNHKFGDFSPYLFRTTNGGKSWTSITKGIPKGTL